MAFNVDFGLMEESHLVFGLKGMLAAAECYLAIHRRQFWIYDCSLRSRYVKYLKST